MTNAAIVNDIKQARLSGGSYTVPGEVSSANLEGAYAFQRALVEGLQTEAEIGEIAGYKIAVNGKPQMAHFGVSEPISGTLFAAEVSVTPEARPASKLVTLCVEPEIAAIIGPQISALGGNPGDDEVLACIDSYAAAMEIIDMRGTRITDSTLAAAVSLNIFNHGCVLGTERVSPADLRIEEITAELTIDGVVAGSATNNAPQPPVEAVKWLAGHLRKRGLELKEGMVVMCGTHIPIHNVPAGSRDIRIDMSGLGSAELSLV